MLLCFPFNQHISICTLTSEIYHLIQILEFLLLRRSRVSSVSIGTRLWAGRLDDRSSIMGKSRRFLSSSQSQVYHLYLVSSLRAFGTSFSLPYKISIYEQVILLTQIYLCPTFRIKFVLPFYFFCPSYIPSLVYTNHKALQILFYCFTE